VRVRVRERGAVSAGAVRGLSWALRHVETARKSYQNGSSRYAALSSAVSF